MAHSKVPSLMCRGPTVEVKGQLVWVSSLLYHVGVPGMNSVHQVKYLLPTEPSHQALPSQMLLQLPSGAKHASH